MQQTNEKHNGTEGNVSVLDLIEEDPLQETVTGSFFDSSDPVLQAAKQDGPKKKGWKRRLVTWSFILLLIAAGVVALYLLLRVKLVNVIVQSGTRPSPSTAKPKNEPANSENGLTAEAINIARAASGADATTAGSASPSSTSISPSASPVPSPAGGPNNLSFTGSSPAFAAVNDPTSTNNNSNLNANGRPPSQSSTELQSRANSTQSIFVDDAQPKAKASATPVAVTQSSERSEKKIQQDEKPKTAPAVLPPFGTMLPVRTQGVVFTLRNNSYARLELTRDMGGAGWSLSKGTVIVGRTSGSEYDRAFVNVIGYIDPRDNKLVKMSGDVLGVDGAAGLPGKRIGVDRNRFKQTLRKVAASGVQVAGIMAGSLTGRGTVVIDGTGYRLLNPVAAEARNSISASDEKNTFVKVPAGQAAYVMVADLPKSIQAVDAPGQDNSVTAPGSLNGSLTGQLTGPLTVALTDREVMELILFGTPDDIRAALPLMTEEQKKLTLKTVQPEEKR